MFSNPFSRNVMQQKYLKYFRARGLSTTFVKQMLNKKIQQGSDNET